MTKQRMMAVVCATALVGGLSLTSAGGASAAQEVDSVPAEGTPASYEEQIDAFFARVAAGEHAEAIDGLYAGSPLASELGDQLEELKAQLGELAGMVGPYLGQERIAVQPLGERFVYVWHVAYFEKRPFQMHFSFYKPQDRWLVFQLAYDQGMTGIAQELAKRRLAQAD